MLPDPYSLLVVKVVLYMANTEATQVTAPRHHRPSRAVNDSLDPLARNRGMGSTAACVALVYESPWRRKAEKVDEGTPIPTLPSITWSERQTRRVALLWCTSRPGAE